MERNVRAWFRLCWVEFVTEERQGKTYSYLSTEAQLSRLLATYIWILGTHSWAKHVGILGEWEMIFTNYISLPSVLYDCEVLCFETGSCYTLCSQWPWFGPECPRHHNLPQFAGCLTIQSRSPLNLNPPISASPKWLGLQACSTKFSVVITTKVICMKVCEMGSKCRELLPSLMVSIWSLKPTG